MKSILTLLFVFCVVHSIAQSKVAYLVAISADKELKLRYVNTAEQAKDVVNAYIGQEFNFDEILKSSVFFDLKTEKYLVYVERKTVIRKKNGKIKYKRYKQKHKR